MLLNLLEINVSSCFSCLPKAHVDVVMEILDAVNVGYAACVLVKKCYLQIRNIKECYHCLDKIMQ